MKPQPTVSAIITVYNGEQFVGQAIESVLKQTHPVDEFLVVDDGSTDRSAEVVARYAADGVRYVRQPNGGAGSARNLGIAETSGDLIAFLDCDDTWLSQKNAQQVAYMRTHPDAVMVSGDKWLWDVEKDTRSIQTYGVKPGVDIRREILVYNVIGNPSMTMIRRSALQQVGVFNTKPWGEDWELWIRLVQYGSVGFIPEPVIIYRWHPSSLSHDRRMKNLSRLFEVSQLAINAYLPNWRKPFLLARSWSNIQTCKTSFAVKHNFSFAMRVWLAMSAFFVYPFEHPVQKLLWFARAIIGNDRYSKLRQKIKSNVKPTTNNHQLKTNH